MRREGAYRGEARAVERHCDQPLRVCSWPSWFQAGLTELKDVLFVGNPMYEGMDRKDAKLQVLKRLPQVTPGGVGLSCDPLLETWCRLS